MPLAIIIEDEMLTANRLEKLVQQIDSSIRIVAKLPTITASVDWLQNNPSPDLIFMDIHLADGNSFEIFKLVQIASPIIFTTAYDQYAIQAFKVNSIDYLLKPIEKESLAIALKSFSASAISQDQAILNQLLLQIQQKETVYRNRYLITHRDTLVPITVDKVAYFGSEFKNTFLVTHSGEKYFIEKTMDEAEAELDPKLFIRITRQFIVCMQAIGKIHTYFNGRLKIELLPPVKDEIIVSREKSLLLKEWLNQ